MKETIKKLTDYIKGHIIFAGIISGIIAGIIVAIIVISYPLPTVNDILELFDVKIPIKVFLLILILLIILLIVFFRRTEVRHNIKMVEFVFDMIEEYNYFSFPTLMIIAESLNHIGDIKLSKNNVIDILINKVERWAALSENSDEKKKAEYIQLAETALIAIANISVATENETRGKRFIKIYARNINIIKDKKGQTAKSIETAIEILKKGTPDYDTFRKTEVQDNKKMVEFVFDMIEKLNPYSFSILRTIAESFNYVSEIKLSRDDVIDILILKVKLWATLSKNSDEKKKAFEYFQLAEIGLFAIANISVTTENETRGKNFIVKDAQDYIKDKEGKTAKSVKIAEDILEEGTPYYDLISSP